MELRPSVLKVGESNFNSTNQETNNKKIEDKVQADNNIFKFAPLIKPVISSSNGGQSSNQEVKTFLFGQNLEERVLLPAKDESKSEEENKTPKEDEKDKLTVNATTSDSSTSQVNQTLPEKRKYEAITGEEDESNVLQMFCKLYLWESATASWKEKGKGMLRLNDKMKDDKLCSRLVMRTAGSLKVILNASIVSGMKFELSNENVCLRFINIDGIYLIKGKEKDIEQLNSAIECRLRELSKKVKVESKQSSSSTSNILEEPKSRTPVEEDTKNEQNENDTKDVKDMKDEKIDKEKIKINEGVIEDTRKETINDSGETDKEKSSESSNSQGQD